jgi:hypothetical protein
MLGFLVGAAAGFLTPHAEDTLARPVERALGRHMTLEPGELRLLSFMLAMLIAGIVAQMLNSGSAFWVILGGALGYFATRLSAAARIAMDDRRRK